MEGHYLFGEFPAAATVKTRRPYNLRTNSGRMIAHHILKRLWAGRLRVSQCQEQQRPPYPQDAIVDAFVRTKNTSERFEPPRLFDESRTVLQTKAQDTSRILSPTWTNCLWCGLAIGIQHLPRDYVREACSTPLTCVTDVPSASEHWFSMTTSPLTEPVGVLCSLSVDGASSTTSPPTRSTRLWKSLGMRQGT